ncbi:MAG TPA: hypothetical protein VK659_00085 [Asanoa sp.]|nr:hypothetical protein [Asanoa sp.]
MAKLVMVALTNAAPGREDDFHAWYDKTHIPQIRAAVPGVGQVTRYRVGAGQQSVHEFLCVYEVDAGSPAEVLGAVGAGVQSGAVEMTDAMSTDPAPITVVYEAL